MKISKFPFPPKNMAIGFIALGFLAGVTALVADTNNFTPPQTFVAGTLISILVMCLLWKAK